MKKLLTILLTVLMLVGCSTNRAKAAVEKAITDYKTLVDASMKATSTESSSIETTYTVSFMEIIYDFDYEIKSIEEKDNDATATVIIKTMNITTLMDAYGTDQEVIDAGNKLNEETDETKAKEYVNVLVSKLKEYAAKTPKDYESELLIPLVKEDGNWTIDSSYDLSSNLSAAILASALEAGN